MTKMKQMTQPAQQNNNMNDFSDFLAQAKWVEAKVTPMSADMGLRRYFKLEKDGKVALLMDMSRAGILETGLKEYVDVATYLKSIQVRVPEIYHYDLKTGYAVIEYCGDVSFGKALKDGVEKSDIYAKANDVLVQIERGTTANVLGLGAYEDSLIFKRLSQFIEYYMPSSTGQVYTHTDDLAFRQVLKDIETSLPPCPMGFCHADYHLENIIWNEGQQPPYTLIDFQDAFWGFKGYDLLNLLEDARATVPSEIKKAAKDKFCEGMSADERENFENWYVLLSAHFHLRVIGLFIKFSLENERQEFISHIPRLQNYLKDELKNPVLKPIKEWIEQKGISFDISVEDLIKRA